MRQLGITVGGHGLGVSSLKPCRPLLYIATRLQSMEVYPRQRATVVFDCKIGALGVAVFQASGSSLCTTPAGLSHGGSLYGIPILSSLLRTPRRDGFMKHCALFVRLLVSRALPSCQCQFRTLRLG